MARINALLKGAASTDFSDLPEWIKSMPRILTDSLSLVSQSCGDTAIELNASICRALCAYVQGEKSQMALIKVGENAYASEWKKADGTYVLAAASGNGALCAATYDGNRFQPIPTIGGARDPFDTASILLLYFGLCSDLGEENGSQRGVLFKEVLERVKEAYSEGEIEKSDISYIVSSITSGLNHKVTPCDIANGNVELMSRKKVEANAYRGEVLCGNPEVLNKGGSAAKTAPQTVAAAKGRFAEYARKQTWTAEQQRHIRSFPDDYIVPKEVLEIADWFISAMQTSLPANNFAWRGITGCGKSTGAALLSCILNKPLYIMTCHTNMETSDFISTLVPETSKTCEGLPEADDIMYAPADAWAMMTGEEKADATPQECLEMYAKVAGKEQKGTTYKRVTSEYVKALECGGIVEIQEFSRIRDSGVLVGLNEYDHAGAVIPLVDGTYAVRHPEAITLWTDNIGYASCRTVDPSVMRRMTAVIDTFELDATTVIQRVMYNTGSKASRIRVEGMYKIWYAVREYCKKEEISDGDLSPCDLENWVSRYEMGPQEMDDLLNSCLRCVVAKTSSDAETQSLIMEDVVKPALAQVNI